MRHAILAALMMTAVLLPGAARADGEASLAGSAWGEGTETGPAAVLVQFEQGNKVWGRLGCNRFTGTYSEEGGALRFGTFATTRMACPKRR